MIANIIYTTLGDPKLGKEYYEFFGHGRALTCNDLSEVNAYGYAIKSPGRRGRVDKGYRAQLIAFAETVRGQDSAQGHTAPGADARAGLLATWMVEAARESAKTGMAIHCNL